MKEKITKIIIIMLDLIFLIMNLFPLVWVYAFSEFLAEKAVNYGSQISWILFGVYLLLLRYVLLKYMPSVLKMGSVKQGEKS